MRTWDISKAKFYSELMNWMVSFLNLNPTDSTEAEVHSAATAITETLDSIKTKAVDEARDAVKEELSTMKTQMDGLSAQMKALNDKATQAEQSAATLTTEMDTLKQQLAVKDAELAKEKADHKTAIDGLTSELAKAKAGGGGELEVKTQTFPHLRSGNTAGKAVVIESKKLDAFFGRPGTN